ncbi:adp-ribosylation factor gtpase-activating protein agd12, partial [Nannochloropsis gaditana]
MAAQARELLRLLRLPSNRSCADCDAPLNDSTNVWASITHGVFVCVTCVSVHRRVGTHISRVRSVNLDVWTEEETACMRELSGNGGNVYVNSIYERYLPRGCVKPSPDAAFEEREMWIRAKYEHKVRLLPFHHFFPPSCVPIVAFYPRSSIAACPSSLPAPFPPSLPPSLPLCFIPETSSSSPSDAHTDNATLPPSLPLPLPSFSASPSHSQAFT